MVVVLVSIVIPSGQSTFEKVCNLNETAIKGDQFLILNRTFFFKMGRPRINHKVFLFAHSQGSRNESTVYNNSKQKKTGISMPLSRDRYLVQASCPCVMLSFELL